MTQDKANVEELAAMVRDKSQELLSRARTLRVRIETQEDEPSEFSIQMVRASLQAVEFWLDQLEKAAVK
ncbi:hypothetical protein rosmuc_03020 [Roseovarius mucosus DSM 17069]|uniref:Uncharacterized protein n=1 Tax=Roseovarius mucosus DSM 17069 TaxID=1288298 RepID=A0A0A0HG33_9RHOB|nr:hypothetical protein [Roseovarius mucosus]KGM86727.1 hypothetical protein rosmuc_03020 [Roseovarius mucosus DSM 17069]